MPAFFDSVVAVPQHRIAIGGTQRVILAAEAWRDAFRAGSYFTTNSGSGAAPALEQDRGVRDLERGAGREALLGAGRVPTREGAGLAVEQHERAVDAREVAAEILGGCGMGDEAEGGDGEGEQAHWPGIVTVQACATGSAMA